MGRILARTIFRPRWVRWWLWLPLIALAAGLGPLRAWLTYRSGPDRCFSAGLAAFAEGDLDSVQAACEGLRGLAGFEPHWHLLEGMVLLRGGRLVEAIQEFGHAKDHPQTAAQSHLLSGEALYRGKQFRDAERILAKALELEPGLTDARRWLASIYYDLGAMALARQQLLKVAEEAPDDPRPLRLQALIDKDFELYAEAIAEYREALRRGPDAADREDMQFELAECLFKSGQFPQAIEALATCSRDGRTLALEGECRYAMGEPATARRLVEQSLRLTPDHLEGLLLSASLQLEAGEADAAFQTLEKAKSLYPKESRVYHKLAQVCRRLNRSQEALEHARTGSRLRERMTRFAELHRTAIREPANVEVRYQLGLAARELGKPELARSWFEAVLGMDPTHTGARKALAAEKP